MRCDWCNGTNIVVIDARMDSFWRTIIKVMLCMTCRHEWETV